MSGGHTALAFALGMAAGAVMLSPPPGSEPDFGFDLSVYRPPAAHVQVVVARYAEDLAWLDRLPFEDVLVYDKGPGQGGNPPPYARTVKLPNVGRCDHTYLHHIVHNYDNLADVTLFVPGSCPAFTAKWNKLSWVVAHVSRTGGSAFPVDLTLDGPVHKELGTFKMPRYQAAALSNALANPEESVQLSPHRPFGEFYRQNFPDRLRVREVMYKGVFAASRDLIHQTPRESYARLLSYLDNHSNPEAGHFIERSWLAMFHPIPDECISSQHSWDDEAGLKRLACCGALGMLALLLVSFMRGR